MYKIDIDKLDLNRVYTFKEFEFINNELETHTLFIDGKPISQFELGKNGKLIPMPQSPISMEVVVAEIARQLGNWNVHTHQKGKLLLLRGVSILLNQTMKKLKLVMVIGKLELLMWHSRPKEHTMS